MNRRRLLLSLAALLPHGAIAAESPSAALRAIGVKQPRVIHDLAMQDGDGRAVKLEDHAGNLLVLNLWAPWCLPCREEMPSLSRLQQKLSGRPGQVLPLSFDWRGAIGVRQFYAETGITNLPILVGEANNLQTATGMVGLPTTLIVDRQGLHVSTVIGGARWDDDATLDWLMNSIGA